MAQKKLTPDQKRTHLRDELWPGSADLIWSVHDRAVVGFTTITRLMPLIMHLLKILAADKKTGKAADPSAVYLDLWCRNFGQGIVTITDEEDCAYSSGYSSTRAVRTWKEHIGTLEKLGFIRTKPSGNRDYAYILLIDPIQVCRDKKAKLPEPWWNAFSKRAADIGAIIPAEESKPVEEVKPQEWDPPAVPRRRQIILLEPTETDPPEPPLTGIGAWNAQTPTR